MTERAQADTWIDEDGRRPMIRLPDLPTMVALAGTVQRAEVGGNVCFNTVVAITTLRS